MQYEDSIKYKLEQDINTAKLENDQFKVFCLEFILTQINTIPVLSPSDEIVILKINELLSFKNFRQDNAENLRWIQIASSYLPRKITDLEVVQYIKNNFKNKLGYTATQIAIRKVFNHYNGAVTEDKIRDIFKKGIN